MHKFKNIDVFVDYHDFGFCSELKKIKTAKNQENNKNEFENLPINDNKVNENEDKRNKDIQNIKIFSNYSIDDENNK